MRERKGIGYDVLGNIVIVKFPVGMGKKEKEKIAKKILKEKKSVSTVVEKIGKFKGRLRKQKTKHVFGLRTKESRYKENGCVFRFNIDETYFSPRLGNERKELSKKIKKGEKVLVMFSGVSPYAIVIAKNSKAEKVYSNEINREANKYGKLNIELNKLKSKVELLPGDIKKVAGKIKSLRTNPSVRLPNRPPLKYDIIVMPRPQLKESFLKEAFVLSKKGTRIFYYDFCDENLISEVVDKIKSEAKKAKKKIKILKTKVAGEVGPYKVRVRVDFKVL